MESWDQFESENVLCILILTLTLDLGHRVNIYDDKKGKERKYAILREGVRKPLSWGNVRKRGGGQTLSATFDFFFFLRGGKDAECSETECILLKNLVIKNILSKTYVSDHSGSFDMHIGKRLKK